MNPLVDGDHQPTDDEVRAALGPAYAGWTRLIELVTQSVPAISELWHFTKTGAGTGWGLRLLSKKRIIVYMTPREGWFLVSFALGERAVAAAREARLAPAVLKAIDEAPRYAEGRGVRIEVRSSDPVPALAALAVIKSEH